MASPAERRRARRASVGRRAAFFLAGAGFVVSSCVLLAPLERRSGPGKVSDAPEGGTPVQTGDASNEQECATHADCNQRDGATGRPYACTIDRKCVPLQSDQCPFVYGGNPSDPGAIFFGAYATLRTTVEEDSAVLLNYRLALDELNGADGGLPGRAPGSRPHPLVMIVCDNNPDQLATDPMFLDKSLSHLILDLHVPGVAAYLLPDDLRYAFDKYAAQNHTFLISPIGATKALEAEPDQERLLWHMLGLPSDLAPGYVALSKLLQTYVKKALGIDSVKVATVTSTAGFDSELAEAVIGENGLFETNLVFNGKSLTQNALDGNYRGFTIDPNDPARSPAQIGADIVALKPNIVISLTDTRFTRGTTGVLPTVEMLWEPSAKRPFYILSPINAGSISDVQAIINDLSEISTNRYQRFIGVGVAGAQDKTLYNDYLGRLAQAFQKQVLDTENFYDAIYFLAYAMYAAGLDEPLNGVRIVGGMDQLTSGLLYPVGPDRRTDVLRALNQGPVRLVGTLGPPDFDPHGGRIDTPSVFCFDANAAPQLQVLRYDRTLDALVGTFPCFDGFFP